MNKTTLSVIILVIAAVLVYAFFMRGGTNTANVTKIEGQVVNIDLEQAMFDGPYIVVVKDEDGADYVIHVPSMGLGLCTAREAIVNPSELSVGMKVEVSGMLTPDGILVPCESPDHYLRVDN